jgi:Tfp pilus assembly protein PilF
MKNTLKSIMRHGSFGTIFFTAIFLVSCATNTELPEKTTAQKKSEIYYGQGTNELVKKNYAQALINLVHAKEFDPTDSQVRNNLGKNY